MRRVAAVLAIAFAAILVTTSVVDGIARARSAAAMAEGARKFLAALTPEQRSKAEFKFDDEERFDWHFIPKARKGLPMKELSADQRKLALELLHTGLSQTGYLKATTIMTLENILREVEKGSGPTRDPELYYVSIFGTPSAKDPWAWRFEGHHCALNFTLTKGTMVATTPSFFGANPAEVRQGPRKGLRVLAAEEDLGRELIKSLDEKQRKQAIFDQTAPKEIITANKVQVDPLAPAGIPVGQLTPAQTEHFKRLLDEYLSRMPEDLAAERLEKLRHAGMEKIYFGWCGGIERGDPHYYRLQGPTFLVEYDDTQNDANHIHTVWRDFNGDFGRDLLKEHYQSTSHKP
jgi:hypothetical protein